MPLLGNLLTSFENGLLGENYSAGTSSTARAVGSAAGKVVSAVPGVSAAAQKLKAAGARAGTIAANTGLGMSNMADQFTSSVEPEFSGSPATSINWDALEGTGAYAKQDIPYTYADLAKEYGMDASTAYQEALSNTSYQRMVKDLQAAGLNPILATGRTGASSDIYGALADQPISGSFSSANSGKAFTVGLSALGSMLDLFGITHGAGRALRNIGVFMDSVK